MELTTLVIASVGTLAAIVAAIASIKALLPKAKPVINEMEVFWPDLDLSANERLEGTAKVFNNGSRPCSIMTIRFLADGWEIKTLPATAEERLPKPIEAHHPAKLKFRCSVKPQQTAENDTDRTPDTLTMELGFDCVDKPLRKVLTRVGDTDTFK